MTKTKSEYELQRLNEYGRWITFYLPEDLKTAEANLAWNRDNARMNGSKKEFRLLINGKEVE